MINNFLNISDLSSQNLKDILNIETNNTNFLKNKSIGMIFEKYSTKSNKKKIFIKFTDSKIMNQLSYKVISKNKLMKKIKLKNEIKSDIKKIFYCFKAVY